MSYYVVGLVAVQGIFGTLQDGQNATSNRFSRLPALSPPIQRFHLALCFHLALRFHLEVSVLRYSFILAAGCWLLAAGWGLACMQGLAGKAAGISQRGNSEFSEFTKISLFTINNC